MAKQIERINELSKKQFEKLYLNNATPVIISSGIDWKALKWTPEYFQSLFPEKTVDLVLNYSMLVGEKKYLKSTIVEKNSIEEAINLIYRNKNNNLKYYLSQKSIYKDFPELINDIETPPWIDKNVKFEDHTVNLWFGEAGNASPLHYDQFHNFLLQIYGKKYIRLFSPLDTKYLYRHTIQTRGPHHISQISDIDDIDNLKYPQFKFAIAYEGILHPEETLFIPAGWWHDIRSLDHAISLNFWWKPKINECISSQILPISVYELYESGKFEDTYELFSDLNDFSSDLEISQYCMEYNKYNLSVLYMANYFVNLLKSIAMLLNISIKQTNNLADIENINQSILYIREDLGVTKKELSAWLNLITKAKDENDNVFEKNDLISMHNQIQTFSKKIKLNFVIN